MPWNYQWVRSDGSTGANIGSASRSTYTLTTNDEGRMVKVRFTFSCLPPTCHDATCFAKRSNG